MSSDFSITEFRRRRASDNPPPPETGQLPLEMPVSAPTGPQEYVPQTVSVPMPAPIPEAVPQSPHAAETYAPMADYIQPAVSTIAVQPPVPSQGAVPLPMPASIPAVGKSKKESKSLFAGLLGKFKKESAFATSPEAQSGPIEYQAAPIQQNIQSEARQVAPLRAAIPVKVPALDTAPMAKPKSGLPTWAAFLLGLMTGVILTFAGLAFTAKTVENSLETRFSETAKAIQSIETATEEDAAETPEPSAPLL